MSKYKKGNHVEFSDGDTQFISVEICPLTDVEIEEEPEVLNNEDYVCCLNSDKNFRCPHFYKYLSLDVDDESVSQIQCDRLNPNDLKHIPFTNIPKNNEKTKSVGGR